jgi:hypothetical protein
MFELHVVVAAVVMLNILELIIEIVPNYSTLTACFAKKNCIMLDYYLIEFYFCKVLEPGKGK